MQIVPESIISMIGFVRLWLSWVPRISPVRSLTSDKELRTSGVVPAKMIERDDLRLICFDVISG